MFVEDHDFLWTYVAFSRIQTSWNGLNFILNNSEFFFFLLTLNIQLRFLRRILLALEYHSLRCLDSHSLIYDLLDSNLIGSEDHRMISNDLLCALSDLQNVLMEIELPLFSDLKGVEDNIFSKSLYSFPIPTQFVQYSKIQSNDPSKQIGWINQMFIFNFFLTNLPPRKRRN